MNFFVVEMNSLKYFVPLIQEGNKRGILSTVYWQASGKYNCPERHIDNLKALSKKIKFKLEKYTKEIINKNPTFLIEGIGHQNFKGKKIALTVMSDYRGEGGLYDQSINNVDYYVFPNKSWVESIPEMGDSLHGEAKPNKPKLLNSKKNLFLGSPKYDINLNKQDIIEKYGLSSRRKCFLFYPRHRDIRLIDMLKVLSTLQEMNYEILIKYREKELCNLPTNKNIKIFKDESWYPHTSMELIYASDIVVNTDSTGVKECVFFKKPILNFKIKPFTNWFNFLYDEKFHQELRLPFDYELMKQKIEYLELAKDEDFNKIIDKLLFKSGSCKRILDFLDL